MRELATEGPDSEAVRLLSPPSPAFKGRMADLAADVDKAVKAGERVVLAMSRPGSAQRLAEVLDEYEVPVGLLLEEEEAELAGFARFEVDLT